MSAPVRVSERTSQRHKGLQRIIGRDLVIIILAGGISLAILCIWLFPRVMGLYYVSAGSRMLDRAIQVEQLPVPPDFACNTGFIQNPQAVESLRQATRFLHRAVSYHPREAQAHLLLGRAYCLAGEPERAAQSFLEYIAIHPANPLGQIELGFAYASSNQMTSAISQWRELNLSPDDFIAASQSARVAGHMESAASWYRYATSLLGYELDSFEGWTGAVPVSFESFYSTQNWRPYPANSAGVFETSQGILRMQYANNPGQRDIFSYTSYIHMETGGQKEFLLRLRGDGGTPFTLEVVIDGNRKRLGSYQMVGKDWEIWSYPLQGALLTEITIGIGEETQSLSPSQYELWVDWFAIQ